MSSIAQVAAPVIPHHTASATAAAPNAIGHPSYVANRLQFVTDQERGVWSTIQHLNAGDDHLTEFYTPDRSFMREDIPASKALRIFHQKGLLGLMSSERRLIDTATPDYQRKHRDALFATASQARLFFGTRGENDRRAFLLVDAQALSPSQVGFLAPTPYKAGPRYEGFPHGSKPYPKPKTAWDTIMPSEYPVFPASESDKYKFYIRVPDDAHERFNNGTDVIALFTPDRDTMPWYRMLLPELIANYFDDRKYASGVKRNTPMPDPLPGDFYFNKRHYTLQFPCVLDTRSQCKYNSVATSYNTLQLRDAQGNVVDVLGQATYGQTLLYLRKLLTRDVRIMPNDNEGYYPLCAVSHDDVPVEPSSATAQVASRVFYYFECNAYRRDVLRCTRLQQGEMERLEVVSRGQVDYRETRGKTRSRDAFVPAVVVREPSATAATGFREVGQFDLPLTDLETMRWDEWTPQSDAHLVATMRLPNGTEIPTKTMLAYELRQTPFLNDLG